MDNFRYCSPTTVYFGKGQIESLSREIINRGFRNVLIVTGKASAKKYTAFKDVVSQINKTGIRYSELSGIRPNPRIKTVYEGIRICRRDNIDLVLGVGGGSVIDASKTIAAGAVYDGDCWDFFDKLALPQKTLPTGCVLTLAATGTETNGNAVITHEERQKKLALCADILRPVFAILDPVYTFTVDEFNTAAGIVDIMAHVFEQYFSRTPACDVQDRLCEGILNVCIKYAPVVIKEKQNYDARANIMWAGTLALNGLLGAGRITDWSSHGIEHEISAVYDISHGAGLSVIVPNWMRHVLSKETACRFADYGRNIWSAETRNSLPEIANYAIDRTREFFNSLGMPSNLRQMGIDERGLEEMAKNIAGRNAHLGSFVPLDQDDILSILKTSL
ncbi:MAG: iron-containing alcohol dehydrogenase [Candidatus Omnitrophica bacterium]|nr:iron-containing alcohol dehydrogenase [Candidatus Omnitrophota bacterium]